MADCDLPDLIPVSATAPQSATSEALDMDKLKINDKVSESDEDDIDDGDDDNFEDDEILPPDAVPCFFCDTPASLPQTILDHCIKQHNCHLAEFVKKNALPTESIIKLVNYIRKERPSPAILSQTSLDQTAWTSDSYMLPVCPEDHGITSLLIWDWSEADPPAEPFPAPTDDKNSLLTLLAGGDGDLSVEARRRDQDDCRNVDYFDSYSNFNIHCEMLRDKVRTESYRSAIADCAKDKVVLDIGCGSGVLSCFAAAAGAKTVLAVDKADIIQHAHEIARANGLADKIEFVHGDLDRLKLSIQQVDVIVSEWMGYFLLFEGMLDSVIAARDKYLAPGGKMIPSSANLYLTVISDDKDWQSTVGMWNDAYGLKFECLRGHTLRYPSVHAVDPESVVSSNMTLRSFDLMTCQVKDLDFSTTMTFTPTKSCNITALVGFFDVGYDASDGQLKVMFRTSPVDTTTHWAQSVFYLDIPYVVNQDDTVLLSVDIKKAHDDKRGLTVSFRMKSSVSGHEWHQTYDL